MNNPVNHLHEQPSEITSQAPAAFRVVLFRIISDVIFFVVLSWLAFLSGTWQLFSVAGLVGATLFLAVIGARWIRRGQVERGAWVVIFSLFPTVLLSPVFIVGVGLVAGMALVLLTVMTATQTLPAKRVGWVVGASIGVGIATFLLDWFGPTTYRLATPPILIFAPIASGVLILGLAALTLRQFANYSIRTKLIIGFAGTGILIAGIIIFATDYFTRQELTDVANQALLAAAKQTANDVDNFIRSNLDNVTIEAKLPAIVNYLNMHPGQRSGSPEEAEASAVLDVLSRKDNPYLSSYALLDRQGQDILDTYVADVGLNKADLDYFEMILKTGQPYVSPVRFSKTVGDASIYFSAPVRNNLGEIVGVIRVRYDAVALQQIIRLQNEQAGRNSYAILLDENQIYLAHGTATNFKLKTVAALDSAYLIELQANGRLPNKAPAELTTNFSDFSQALTNAVVQPYFTGYIGGTNSPADLEQVAITALQTQPWQIAFAQPQEVFLEPVTVQTRNTILLATGVVILVMGVAFILGQYLTRPIISLTEVAQRVTGGDLAVQAVVETQDEVGQLAEAFNSMTKQLRASIGLLEDQVRERTAELALSMEVGQRATAIRSLDELLPTITEYIRTQFNLYYTQVYFADDLRQNLTLKAGTGRVGQELVAHRHQLPIGLGSIVGRVAAEGKPVVVADTQNSDIHKANSLLPETRSELAIPLVVEDRVIGVLDMQASKVNTFTENNLTVFAAMATQLAVSIDSAQQWERAQEAQQKAEAAVKRLTRQSWAESLASRREGLGFGYDLSTIAPLAPTELEAVNGDPKQAVPIVVQNEAIGLLAVDVSAKRALSPDEQDLLAAVAQQLGQKAENLRLFEQTQQRATREQMARQISEKVRASRDIEAALKVAAEELSKALGTARAVVDLKVASPSTEQQDQS